MAKRFKPLVLTRDADDSATNIQWSPDGNWLVAMGGTIDDSSPKLVFWNTQFWKVDEISKVPGLGGDCAEVTKPFFSKDGACFAVAGAKNVKVFRSDSRKCTQTLPLIPKDAGKDRSGYKRTETKVTSLCFNDSATLLAASAWDCHAKTWDLATGKLIELNPDHENNVELVSFIHGKGSAEYLLSVTHDEARFWNVITSKVLSSKKLRGLGLANCMSRANDELIVATDRMAILRWDVSNWKAQISRIKSNASPRDLVVSPASDVVGIVQDDCTAIIWDYQQKAEVARLGKKWGDTLQSMSFSPDGRQVALSFNNSLQIYDLTTLSQH